MTQPDPIDRWLDPLLARHTHALSRPEFLKAVRALSARYVERRAEITRRSPTDSAGKRAAFSAFFAPLHFLTVRAIVRALDAAPLDDITDLGCGTGVAGAAWALHMPTSPVLAGVDREAWALDEATWNWRTLGLSGRARRGDLVAAASDLLSRRRASARAGVVLGWSVNELATSDRDCLEASLLGLAAAGTAVLIVEPLARTVTPWWDRWADSWQQHGGRADTWKFPADLPPLLAELSETAGFNRQELGARTLSIGVGPAR